MQDLIFDSLEEIEPTPDTSICFSYVIPFRATIIRSLKFKGITCGFQAIEGQDQSSLAINVTAEAKPLLTSSCFLDEATAVAVVHEAICLIEIQ